MASAHRGRTMHGDSILAVTATLQPRGAVLLGNVRYFESDNAHLFEWLKATNQP